jgi:hypothetical protein
VKNISNANSRFPILYSTKATQIDRHDAVLIKVVIKIRSELEGVNEMLLIKTRARKLIMKFVANAKNEQNSQKMHVLKQNCSKQHIFVLIFFFK